MGSLKNRFSFTEFFKTKVENTRNAKKNPGWVQSKSPTAGPKPTTSERATRALVEKQAIFDKNIV